ncbi:aminotransferase class I/II-fold pyridoxal phosphate-dependent enzyme [Rhodococcus corynebacterioides]|uniref:Aminotransferase n=2 Tax=Rhodococcoides corynebacterioides TaxID=53972 RepID=A0ABS7P0P7_9NOCA|nr:aminotransferase class I/II-fold pyridoxal phosphate-dependent enzyme [Rhodococcus corynebacterioides]MBY6365274.1 aminotransferase class I/II-fold pyridoxal phosphate-dependent enzyme [Rhodococcus corynebacterioides]MBY6406686.1 aminotransferase class I/II-fold pyridoxal phosphate-dependent enzyme [Rhodococcus corynebacterioides]
MTGESARSRIEPFHVMDVVAAAARRQRTRGDVVSLAAGQPSTRAPRPVLDAMRTALEENAIGYSETLGLRDLRERIAAHLSRGEGVDVAADDVVVTTGSSGAFTLLFLAAFDAGDTVVVARPGYPAYRNTLAALGCRVVELDCDASVRFQPTVAMLDALPAPPAGLIVASPANPTGTVIDPDELAALARWCDEHGTLLISDEIYHGITYDGVRCRSARAFSDRAVVVGSVSKYFSMTGWRLGWAVVPPELLRAVERLASNMTVCPPTVSQVAAMAAFDDASIAELDGHVERYARNREVLLTGLADLGITRTAPADGAFYVYADLGHLTDDSAAWCARVLDETGVAVVPGLDFDTVVGRRTVRFSFAGATEDMHEALTRVTPLLRR